MQVLDIPLVSLSLTDRMRPTRVIGLASAETTSSPTSQAWSRTPSAPSLFLGQLPSALALWAGALSDRHSKRPQLIASDLAAAWLSPWSRPPPRPACSPSAVVAVASVRLKPPGTFAARTVPYHSGAAGTLVAVGANSVSATMYPARVCLPSVVAL
ncbi:hypothetical protein [Streptomyces sp. NPDC048623]|uniref:hypothetical protein n=1 Tax=Streptomyces sp. NPDC048623 TaxID=3155761 RepID=UPI003414CB94